MIAAASSTLSEPSEAVRTFNTAWAAGDIDSAMRVVADDAVYNLYIAEDLLPGGGADVRFQVEFMYRHRDSGEVLSGRFRMVMRVVDGKLVRAAEYHDRGKVEAFLRLFGR